MLAVNLKIMRNGKETMFNRYTHSNSVVSDEYMVSMLQAAGLPNILLDRTYLTLSDSFVKALNKRFAKELFKDDLAYSNKFDCDNYAIMYWNLAGRMFAKEQTIHADAMAIGCLAYRASVGQRHMLNWYIDERKQVVVVEPQKVDRTHSDITSFTSTDWANINYIMA